MTTLYMVATPIGNLKDITYRAVEVLQNADFILAEDSRVTLKLLNHFEIQKQITALHQHTKPHKLEQIIQKIKEAQTVALVSDAGTPLVSDPGGKLLELAKQHDIEIIPIPGPSAVTTALSVSGFQADHFEFLGFLPTKKGKQTKLQYIADAKHTTVFFESPHRIKKTLEKLKGMVSPERQIVITREMTKKFEEYLYGTVDQIEMALQNREKIKGEITVVVEGKRK